VTAPTIFRPVGNGDGYGDGYGTVYGYGYGYGDGYGTVYGDGNVSNGLGLSRASGKAEQ